MRATHADARHARVGRPGHGAGAPGAGRTPPASRATWPSVGSGAPPDGAGYPAANSTFKTRLQAIARLLATTDGSGNHLPVRCVTVNAAGGYDTHSNQAAALSAGLGTTTANIRAFWHDLELRGLADRVVISLWSEFGRRPAENGSAGTDHGAAGAAFVIGKDIHQGLIGEFPGLAAGTGLDAARQRARDGRLPRPVLRAAGAVVSRPRPPGSSRPRRRSRGRSCCRDGAPGRRSPPCSDAGAVLGGDRRRDRRAGHRPGRRRCRRSLRGEAIDLRTRRVHEALPGARDLPPPGARRRGLPPRRAPRPRGARHAGRRPCARPDHARTAGRRRPRRRAARRRRPPPRSGATGAPAPAVASSVGAEAYDFGSFVLRLTRTAVPAGDLTIYFRNYDVGEHNLWLDPPAAAGRSPQMISEAVGEGGGATKTVAVTAGTWRLYCSLDGHEAMTRDLAVE